MTDSAFMDAYSEAVGTQIDAKFNSFSFGTNTRGLNTARNEPFRRNNTIFLPNNPTVLYPGFEVPPCTFETQCCNVPSSTSIAVSGRLSQCYDPRFEESFARWTYNTRLAPYARKFTTSKVGFDATEN